MRAAAHQDDLTATRTRIIAAAAEIVGSHGIEAATTRAVASAAAVQAPTIYRLFGDKRGLLDAVAEAELAAYVAGKADRSPGLDPVADLRRAWDDHVAFCLAHPAIFAMMSGVGPGTTSPAARAGLDVLRKRIRRVAESGRLCVSEERAVDLVHAAGSGIVGVLMGKAEDERADLAFAAREAVMTAIMDERISDQRSGGISSVASGLRARLGETTVLSPGERHLLDELLRRMAGGG